MTDKDDCLSPTELEFLGNVRNQIEEYGHSVVLIGDASPRFAYTAGLTAKGLPELFISGNIHPEAVHAIVNDTVSQHSDELVAGAVFDDLLSGGLKIKLVPCDPKTAEMFMAGRLYGLENVTALQLIWPDADGVFPDEGWSLPDETQPRYPA